MYVFVGSNLEFGCHILKSTVENTDVMDRISLVCRDLHPVLDEIV